MLPDDAITHYKNLCSSELANASSELAETLKNFERDNARSGRGIGGAGFAARLGALYVAALAKRAQIVVANLKRVHADFGHPLEADVDAHLVSLGATTMSQIYEGLEGAYVCHLGRYGLPATYPSGMDRTYPLYRDAVHNQITQYLWTLRKVPMKSPNPPGSSPTNITIHGSVGTVQTGANSTAHVQQQWTQATTLALANSIQGLRVAVGNASDIDSAEREELMDDLSKAEAELGAQSPSKGRLAKWLGGVATAVQTVASVKPALEMMRSAANAVGLPL